MSWEDKKLPLDIDEQKQLLQKLSEYENDEKKLARTIKHLEHDREYINTMYENEVRLRDFNENEKEEQYFYNRLLLESCPSFLIVFSKELHYIIGTGELLCKHFGFSDAMEINNMYLQDIFKFATDGEWIEKVENVCQQVLEVQQPANYNEQIDFLSGRRMYVNINISPVMDKENILRGVLFLMNDVTELLLTKEKAEAASKAKSYFLTSISHEIRTPMNAIRGMSNLLNTTSLNDTQKDYVKNILTASDSLLQIINDILDFSKIDSDELELIPQKYHIEDILYDITNMTSLKASEKGLDFIADINPSLPKILMGDQVRIKQMLANILDNAVKYTKEGYVKLTVDFDDSEDGYIVLRCMVEDTGIGIKSDDIDSLFEAFDHNTSKKKHDIKGIGLGLTISKNLALAMNGDIKIQSEYKKGSIFTLTIPQEVFDETPFIQINRPNKKNILLLGNSLASDSVEKMLNDLFLKYDYIKETNLLVPYLEKNSYTHIIYWYNMGESVIRENLVKLNNVNVIAVKDLGMISLQDTEHKIKTLFEPVVITSLAKLLNEDDKMDAADKDNTVGIFKTHDARALLVDDNEINLIVAEELLKHYNISVDTAQSGSEALQLVEKNHYDIIFMDHMMPEMDGIETTVRIRALGGWGEKVPVIALTANAVLGMKNFFIENKLDDYLSKPIDIKELNNVLERWLPDEKLEKEGELAIVQEKEADEYSQKGDFFSSLHQEAGLDVSSSVTLLGGNKDTYKSLIEIFVNKAQANKMQLLQVFDDRNWEDFRIFVHGYKSAFYNIGAKELSEQARKLEIAAIKENYDYIKANFPEFVMHMEELERKLKALIKKGAPAADSPPASPEDREALAAKLSEIEGFLDMLESDEAVTALKEIMKLSYGNDIDALLLSAKEAAEGFDYDEAANGINEIKSKL